MGIWAMYMPVGQTGCAMLGYIGIPFLTLGQRESLPLPGPQAEEWLPLILIRDPSYPVPLANEAFH